MPMISIREFPAIVSSDYFDIRNHHKKHTQGTSLRRKNRIKSSVHTASPVSVWTPLYCPGNGDSPSPPLCWTPNGSPRPPSCLRTVTMSACQTFHRTTNHNFTTVIQASLEAQNCGWSSGGYRHDGGPQAPQIMPWGML